MLSRKEIALRAGVSKTTVTRVLAGDETVLPENRKKIMQVVEDSGYTRNVLASNLAKNKRSTAVAMLVPDMTNYYYMQMFNEMVSCARKYGYTISIYSISTDTLDEVVNEVVCNRVCGIVNLGLDSISEDSLKKVRAAGIKIIYPGWPEDEFYQFNTDYEDGMAEAMAALKEGGAKRVCFIFGTKRRLLQDGRLKAFLKYGHENITIRDNYVKRSGGDAITVMYALRPVVEHNCSDSAAQEINDRIYQEPQKRGGKVAAAIWPWKCKDALFRFNEAADTRLNQDGMAYDADSGDGTVYEYNFSRQNEGGCVMFCLEEAIHSRFCNNVSFDDLSGTISPAQNPDALLSHNRYYVRKGIPFVRKNMDGGTYTQKADEIILLEEEER